MALKKATATPPVQEEPQKVGGFAFERQNYILMIAGLGLMILGFVLMIGGGSDDPNVFNYELFSFRRMTLAPLLIIAGFVVEIFAIMWNPKKKKNDVA